MTITHQLLNFYSDGTRGHRAWISDYDAAQVGRIIENQYRSTAWVLENKENGHQEFIMGRLNK